MSDTKIVDLGDFIPQKIKIGFSVNGRRYDFDFMEATVDDVLRIMAETPEGKDENMIDLVRRTVASFFEQIAPAGTDLKQLRSDLDAIPYLSGTGGLDMKTLHAAIQNNYRPPKVPGV